MTRLRIRRISLVVAVSAWIAAILITLAGGYEFSVAGIVIRGHRVDRLVWLGLVATAVFVALGGGRIRGMQFVPDPRLPGWIAIALSIGVFGVSLALGSKTVGGSDSYGYMSQAHGWLRLDPVIHQPWANDVPWPGGAETFRPLAYNSTPDGTALVPVYSPGLPLLMALAMVVGGVCAAYVVVPLCGAVAVYGTYHLGRVLASDWIGLAAAWLLASSPIFVMFVLQPMSDVPVAAAWTLAFLFAWRRTPAAAALSGFATACAILIRINHAPFTAALVLWFAWTAWGQRHSGRRAWYPVLAYGVGLAPGVIGVALFNWYLNGSPLRSGYGTTSDYFDRANVLPNLWLYGEWLTSTQTPLIWLGAVALLVPIRRCWTDPARRRMAACAGVFGTLLVAQYCLFAVFDVWWYIRFLLAAAPFVFIGMLVVVRTLTAKFAKPWQYAFVTVVVLLPVSVGISAHRYQWDFGKGQADHQVAGRVVEGATEPGSVIFSMQHSGSVRYYAGRMTLRYDYIDPEWLDRSVAWFAERGVHPYALLEGWEVEGWRKRFGATQALGGLTLRPIRTLSGSPGVVLYDLLADGSETPRVVSTLASDFECHPPAPPVTFSLGR